MIGLKFWALIIVAVGSIALTRKSWDFTHTIILALTLWQAVSHFRHVPFFAILCGFWVAPHLQSALTGFGQTAQSKDPFMESRAGKIVASVTCVLVMSLIGFQLKDRLSQLNVDRSQYPVDAFQYMHDHDVGGKIVVTYDWAQYVIGAFCTEDNQSFETPCKVAFDGRFRTCYPQYLVDLHFDWLFSDGPNVVRNRSPKSPVCDPLRVLRLNDPEVVINRRSGELTEAHMKMAKADWALLYQDSIAQVWGRRDIYDNPSSVKFIPGDQRQVSDRHVTGNTPWPALPRSKPREPIGSVALAN